MDTPLIWSNEEYELSEFVRRFTLPQLVKVERGYHGGNEETSLSGGQVLTIHAIREADTIIAKDSRHRNVYIPKTCRQKVNVLILETSVTYYETVAELSQVFPKFARVIKEPESQTFGINIGDILVLKRIVKRNQYLECEIKNGTLIRLPMSLRAGFLSLYDSSEYSILEVVQMFKMPLIVQFIDQPVRKASTVFNSSLGALTLQEVMKEESLICSTRNELLDNRYVVTIPKNMDITVVAASGAIVGDKKYDNLRKSINDGIELSKVDVLESENAYTSRQEIREYMQLSLFNVQSVYAKLQTAQKGGHTMFTKSHGNSTKTTTEAKGTDSTNVNIYESISEKRAFTADQRPTSFIQCLPEAHLIPKSKDRDMRNKLRKYDESEAKKATEPSSRPAVPSTPKPTEIATDLTRTKVAIESKASDSKKKNNYESISDKTEDTADQRFRSSFHGLLEAHLRYPKMKNNKSCKNNGSEADQTTQPLSRPLVPSTPKPAKIVADLTRRKVTSGTKVATEAKASDSSNEKIYESILEKTEATTDQQSTSPFIGLPETHLIPGAKDAEMKNNKPYKNDGSKADQTTKPPILAPVPSTPKPTKVATDLTITKVTSGIKLATKAKVLDSRNKSAYESISKTTETIADQRSMVTSSIQDLREAHQISTAKDTEMKNKKTCKNDEGESAQGCHPPIASKPKPTTIATDLTCLSVDGVAKLLTKHRLTTFVETFKQEEIDGRMLFELDEMSLRDLGLNHFQAKKLLMLIHGWQPKTDG